MRSPFGGRGGRIGPAAAEASGREDLEPEAGGTASV